jgi:hypothetical protein
MLELGLVAAVVVVLALGAVVLPLIPWLTLIQLGAGTIALGLALGVPTGFVYHVKLARTLAARGELPRRWWLAPTSLHEQLRDDERGSVLAWFFAGGAGFVLTILGIALVIAGALVLRSGGP